MFSFTVKDVTDLSKTRKDLLLVVGAINDGKIFLNSKGHVEIDGQNVEIIFKHPVFIKQKTLSKHITMVIEKPACDMDKLKGKTIISDDDIK